MRHSAVLLAAALVLTTLPVAQAEHIPVDEFRKGCGFTEDQWDEGVYDCAGSIPSIQNPQFSSADEADAWLQDGDVVIGVAENGTAKAYPLRILNWHEVVNDEIDGHPIAVTYCPLCASSIAFDRTVDDRELDFHVSGYLFRQDLIMVDEQTHSLWPQIEGTAARGPLHGTDLTLFGSTTVAWEDWKAKHPDTQVLQRPQCDSNETDNQRGCSGGEFQRNYETYPYGNYQADRSVGITGETREDIQGIHPKDSVLGVTLDGASKAYPFSLLSTRKVINDDVDGEPVVITWFSSDGQAFHRPEGTNFTIGEDNDTIVDERNNTYDVVTGRSMGALADLEPIDTVDLFWFAWLDHHPSTQVYTANGTQQVDGHDPSRGAPGPSAMLTVGAVLIVAVTVAVTRRSTRLK